MGNAAEKADTPISTVATAVRKRVSGHLTPTQIESPTPAEVRILRQVIGEEMARFNQVAHTHGQSPLDGTAESLIAQILDDVMGLGPIDTLLGYDAVEDIYIQGPHDVVVVMANGRRQRIDIDFGTEERLLNLAQRALAFDNKRVDYRTPFVDGRMRDGSRIHVGISPCAEPSPQIVIRRHRHLFGPAEDRMGRLIEFGTLTAHSAMLLRMVIRAGASLLVVGSTGSGKTTLLNALGAEVDPLRAVVCIEDTRELDLPGDNVAYMVTRPAGPDGKDAVTQGFLVQQSLRKRADWIILGEARGPEAWDFARAGNTGHAVLGSVHANGAREGVERYRDLCLEAGENIRETVALRNVVRAFRVIVHIEFNAQLRRRVVKAITEPTGAITDQGIPIMQDLFCWDDDRQLLACAGTRPYPMLDDHFKSAGFSYEAMLRGDGIPRNWIRAGEKFRG